MSFPRLYCRPATAVLAVASLLLCLTGRYACAQSPASQFPAYTLTDMGAFPGGSFTFGSAVTDAGQVVGYGYSASGEGHAFFADTASSLRDLGTLPGGTASYALGLNASGQVAGYSSTNSGNGSQHAFLSETHGGLLHDLGVLPGGYQSYAYQVNSQGQVAGVSDIPSGQHAFLSGVNGGPLQDLGTLGGPLSAAISVNDQGQVTGYTFTRSYQHAFLYSSGVMTDLGTLGGNLSVGYSVNASGQVAGYSDISTMGSIRHAFLTGPNGSVLQDLGTLPGGNQSWAASVNAAGQVVGTSNTAGSPGLGPDHAFLFAGGAMTDLNSLISPASGFVLSAARGISDTGLIVGTGITADGQTHSFLLTPAAPVPEFSTTVSLGLLLTLVAFHGRIVG